MLTQPFAELHGYIGNAREKLAELGMKDVPAEMLLSEIVEDLCLQTPLGMFYFWCLYKMLVFIDKKNTDIMHQEELGLLKKEIVMLFNNLSEKKQDVLDAILREMPKVPNFPR